MLIQIVDSTAVNGRATHPGEVVETDPVSAAAVVATGRAGMGGDCPDFSGPVRVTLAAAVQPAPGEVLYHPGPQTLDVVDAVRLWGRAGVFYYLGDRR